MKAEHLRQQRKRRGWTQRVVATKLGVSQPYLSLLERGRRPVTPALLKRLRKVYALPATVVPPARLPRKADLPDEQTLAEYLAQLGYPGFAYLQGQGRVKNPAEVLLLALDKEDLSPRLTEALPWVLLRYAKEMDAQWLLREAKLRNLQNRLGFVVALARKVAEKLPERHHTGQVLMRLEEELKQSRLAAEGTLCQASLPRAKYEWLKQNRPPEAAYWNLLTDWRPEHVRYVT